MLSYSVNDIEQLLLDIGFEENIHGYFTYVNYFARIYKIGNYPNYRLRFLHSSNFIILTNSETEYIELLNKIFKKELRINKYKKLFDGRA